MKRIIMLMVAMMLVLGMSGQAMATFTTGDLIRVVYKDGGTGMEVATDLGAAGTWTTPTGVGANKSYTTSLFTLAGTGASSWSNVNVAYYVRTGAQNFWVSGPAGGQTNNSGAKASLNTAFGSLTGAYSTASGSTKQATISSTATNSYYQLMDKAGLNEGSFADFTSGGVTNLAAFDTVGYVDQYLYFYPATTNNTAGIGQQVAKIRTFADGHTEVSAVSAVPIPAAIYLFGSGLLGLAGFRRKTAV